MKTGIGIISAVCLFCVGYIGYEVYAALHHAARALNAWVGGG